MRRQKETVKPWHDRGELLKRTVLVIVLLVSLSNVCLTAAAQRLVTPLNERDMYIHPYVDLAVLNVTTTPTRPRAGDVMVFGASIGIVAIVDIFSDRYWISVRCLLDGKLWSEEKTVFSGTMIVNVYSHEAWRATPGTHTVTWETEPYQQYDDTNGGNNVGEYAFVVGEHADAFDFSLLASPNLVVERADRPSSYRVIVNMTGEASEQVGLSVTDVPQGATYSFSRPSGFSSYSSTLDVICNSTPVGIYYITLTASGQMRSHSVQLLLIVDSARTQSSIRITMTPESLQLGENVTISGAVTPPHNGTVSLRYTRPDGLVFVLSQRARDDGSFTFTLNPDTPGAWTFSAAWAGDIDSHGTTSATVTLDVKEPSLQPVAQFLDQLEVIPLGVINMIAALLLVMLVLILSGGLAMLKRKPQKTN
jgi:hypothetical protein